MTARAKVEAVAIATVTITHHSIVLDVTGTPAPQGSKTHVGRGRMIESSDGVKHWRAAIKTHLHQHAKELLQAPIRDAVAVHCEFRMPRPKTHYGTGRNAGVIKDKCLHLPHIYAPDLDKLYRSTLDGLSCTLAKIPGTKRKQRLNDGILHDDSIVTTFDPPPLKRYIAPGETPGALITITPLELQA